MAVLQVVGVSLMQQICISLVVSLTVLGTYVYLYGVPVTRSCTACTQSSSGATALAGRQTPCGKELLPSASTAAVWWSQPSGKSCWLDVTAYGAVGDGETDDTAAIVAAIAAAAAVDPKVGDFGCGNLVRFPPGIYVISSTVHLPNRVALQGANGRAVTIRASPSGFVGSCMFHASNGNLSMFGSRLSDMLLDASHLRPASGPIPAVVRADAWQETSGLSRVVLYNFVGYGLELQHGYGGAAYLPLRDIEIFAASSGALAGIMVHKISLVGAFQLSVDGASICGGSAATFASAIVMENDTLHIRGLHVEGVETAVTMQGCGCLSMDTVTGSFSGGVGNLLHLTNTFTGKVSARILMPNGATVRSLPCTICTSLAFISK